MDSEIERLQDAPPPEDEVARAVKQARAMFAYGSESITNQAYWLGFAEMFDTYDWFVNYLDRLAAVTPAEVQRIAQVYLRPQNRVLGTYLPTGNGGSIGNMGGVGSSVADTTHISKFSPPSLLSRERRGAGGLRGVIKT
jgi:hypothetical protein